MIYWGGFSRAFVSGSSDDRGPLLDRSTEDERGLSSRVRGLRGLLELLPVFLDDFFCTGIIEVVLQLVFIRQDFSRNYQTKAFYPRVPPNDRVVILRAEVDIFVKHQIWRYTPQPRQSGEIVAIEGQERVSMFDSLRRYP